MRDIHRPDATESIVERLTTTQGGGLDSPIFPTIMHLLIFCAGIGLSLKRSSEVPPGGKAVPYRIFENNQKEGYIFLVALAAKSDPKLLSGDYDDEIAKLFEEHAAAGLEEVASWMTANPSDISGVATLISKLQTQLTVVAPLPTTLSAV